jgi:hypothetical protein
MKLFIKGKFTRISGPIGDLRIRNPRLDPEFSFEGFSPLQSNQAGNRLGNRGGVE